MPKMNHPIAVMKNHGFHEPAVKRIDWNSNTAREAKEMGINVEEIVLTKGGRISRRWHFRILSEIKAIKASRKVQKWQDIDDTEFKMHVRAVIAERNLRDREQEIVTLKERMKQSDNGAGDWLEERDALLKQLETTEAEKDAALQQISDGNTEKDEEIARLLQLNHELDEHVLRLNEQFRKATDTLRTITTDRDEKIRALYDLQQEFAATKAGLTEANGQIQTLIKDSQELLRERNELQAELGDIKNIGPGKDLCPVVDVDTRTLNEVIYLRSVIDRLISRI